MTTLAELTTFRVGGEVSRLVRVTSSEELVAAVRAADEEQRQLLVLAADRICSHRMILLTELSSLYVRVHRLRGSLKRTQLTR